MGKKSKKWVRKHKGLAAFVGIAGILLVSYLVYGGITGNWLLWWTPPAETPASGDTVEFSILGRDTGSELDAASAAVYGADVADLDADEIDALNGSSFTLLGSNESGEGFTLDADFLYIVLVTCDGYNDQVFVLDTIGIVTVSLLPVGTNASVLGISDTLSTNLLENAVENTTETDWDLALQCLDAEGAANNSLGFRPFSTFLDGEIEFADFETTLNQFVVEIEFNCTADVDWVTLGDELDVTVENSTTSLFLLVNEDVIGRVLLSITLDEGIGTDFNIQGITTGFGTMDLYTPLGVCA